MLFKPSQNVFNLLYGLICFIKRATYSELFKNSFEFCSYFMLDSNVQMSLMTNVVQNWWLSSKQSPFTWSQLLLEVLVSMLGINLTISTMFNFLVVDPLLIVELLHDVEVPIAKFEELT